MSADGSIKLHGIYHIQGSDWLQVERKKGQLVLTEETHREGVLAGSTYLNTMMEDYVRRKLGGTVYDDWKEAKPVDAVKLVHDKVELQKRSFDGTSPIKLEVPLSLLRVIPTTVSKIDIVALMIMSSSSSKRSQASSTEMMTSSSTPSCSSSNLSVTWTLRPLISTHHEQVCRIAKAPQVE